VPEPAKPKDASAKSADASAKPADPSAKPARRTLLKYTPPKNTTGGSRIDGDGGSRGLAEKLPALYVLAPNHPGLTTREQPSLFWYQSAPANTRFEVTLIQPKHPKPLLRLGIGKAEKAGIHRVSLAKQNVLLQPGIVYKWTVAWVPDSANRSLNIIASGTIQRTEPDAKLAAGLAAAPDLDKAALYAQSGIWYDALEAISNEIEAAPGNKELRAARANLLEQAGLKEAAAAERRLGFGK
jgi:hypothetical protein